MGEKFKIGDYVILIDGTGIHTLEQNQTYKIESTSINHEGRCYIALKEDIDENGYQHMWNAERFTKDIKPIRKKKLEKIYGKL